MGLAEGWIVFGRSLFVGGLLEGGLAIGTLFTVPVLGGGAMLGSHGGAATVAEVPAGRVGVAPATPPVSGVVLDVVEGMLDEEEVVGAVLCAVELVELLEVVSPEGGHGATVVLVWLWLGVVPGAPGWVVVVPGCVVFGMPGWVCVPGEAG